MIERFYFKRKFLYDRVSMLGESPFPRKVSRACYIVDFSNCVSLVYLLSFLFKCRLLYLLAYSVCSEVCETSPSDNSSVLCFGFERLK